eukprot:TRINITY_DN14460_c1_g1_i1.p2 TRINITY_DN14460_c1_g1~~TRINITY_DN14460_c1_g1_i1.p2  ORF type:complete len:212 (+),score=62.43 TRINITY_DN14460_c1_g1_i1:199-834(+)
MTKDAARLAAMEDRLLSQQNQDLETQDQIKPSKKRKSKQRDEEAEAAVLHDERFKAMFEDEEFTIDERSEHFKALHPNAVRVSERTEEAQIDYMDQFKAMEDEEEFEDDVSDNMGEEGIDDEGRSGRMVRMYGADDIEIVEAIRRGETINRDRNEPLGVRVERESAQAEWKGVNEGVDGEKEIQVKLNDRNRAKQKGKQQRGRGRGRSRGK